MPLLILGLVPNPQKIGMLVGAVVPANVNAAVSRRPAHSMYLRLTHKLWESYGHALGLSDWRLVSRFDCVGTPE